ELTDLLLERESQLLLARALALTRSTSALARSNKPAGSRRQSCSATGPPSAFGLRERGRVDQQLLHRLILGGAVVAADLTRAVHQHQVRAVHQAEMLGAGRGLALEGQLEAVLGGLAHDLDIAREEAP